MTTLEEIRNLMHQLGLDKEEPVTLAYIFYQTADGAVNNLSVSLHSGHRQGRRPLSDSQLVDIMEGYPAAAGAKIVAIEHPQRGLTQWLDASDVCRQLHTSRQTLRRWVHRGLLHPSRLSRRLYFDPAEVERVLRSNVIQENGRLDRAGLSDNGELKIEN